MGQALGRKIWDFFSTKSFYEKMFFGFLVFQVLCSGLGWAEYKIRFNDMEETVFISAKWNIFFVLLSLFVFIYSGFWHTASVWKITVFSQTLTLVLFSISTLVPEVGVTDILKKSDYKFSPFFYGFAASLLLAWALSSAILWEESRRSKLFGVKGSKP